MKVEIKFPRFEFQHGRHIVYCQLFYHGSDELIMNGSLAQILQSIHDTPGAELVNAQDILDLIVRQNGFAS